MKLYSIHCGYYSSSVGSGIYESHVNLFVVAENFDDARAKAKSLPEFQEMRMHVDGIQEIEMVQGFGIVCQPSSDAGGQTKINIKNHRDLERKTLQPAS